MGIPDHLTCLLRNLYAGQEATGRTRYGTMGWFQIGKGISQAVYCHSTYLTSMQSTSCEMSGDEAHAGIKIARRSINNLGYVDDTTLMAESEEELKSLLVKVKEESKKAGLKLKIPKAKITASGSIMSWQIIEGKVEAVTDILFLGSKITVDDDCNHEMKRCLLLGRKAMTNLDSMLISRDITLLTKVYMIKAMVFPVVM